jgi:signal transduction histidine kinase
MKTKHAKILLIDDNPKNLQVAMNILDREGYDLIYAQNGIKGIELAKKNSFDLILLDVMMPQLDGYSVCKKLKSDPKTEDIPIIFLTVKDDEKDIIKGFECGGIDYVTKPFYTAVLLKRVKTHLTLSQTTKELKNLNDNLEEKIQEQVQHIRLKDQILFQQAKMASMGEMIANIAHQWRQPLTAISASTVVIKTKFGTDGFDFSTNSGIKKCEDYINLKLNDIENYVTLLSTTIDDFRNFFKPQKELSHFTLKQCIEKSLKLLMANFENSNIKIITNIDDIKIVGLENEFAQVLINILNNAQDALLQNEKTEQKLIFINAEQKEDLAEISIRDNGGGIDRDIINKIFEPYFTTKHQSQGTGIGLYMSQEIIQKHMHGEIKVENISYKYKNRDYYGAEFTIKIPLSLKN